MEEQSAVIRINRLPGAGWRIADAQQAKDRECGSSADENFSVGDGWHNELDAVSQLIALPEGLRAVVKFVCEIIGVVSDEHGRFGVLHDPNDAVGIGVR